MKMNKKVLIIAAAVIVLLIVAGNSFFVLREDECAVVTRFGEIIGVYVKEATPELRAEVAADTASLNRAPVVHERTGLKLKIPFIDTPIKFTSRLRTDDSPEQPIITSDKKTLIFDNNAQWRIVNPMKFHMVVQNYGKASSLIDERLYALMRVEVGNILAHDLVTNKDLTESMLQKLTSEINAETRKFGVLVVGINIKRTEVPRENFDAIYNRMNSERNRIAAQYRSEGQEEFLKITSDTDRRVIEIISEAYKNAEILRGEGDSEAAKIYNAAYSKDPSFFEFYNMLLAYRETLGRQTTLVIPLDSVFAKYLLGVGNTAGGEGD